jgi:hypothetical protein
MNKKALTITRLVLGVITLGAVVLQLINSIENGRSIANFFSFFTVQSNILAAGLLVAAGVYGLTGKAVKQIPYIRGALTLFMTMTGIIYILLLSGNEVSLQTTIPAVNIILHYVMPIAVLLDWLVFPPQKRLAFKTALLWLAYPLFYLVYSLIRGAITNWYPYPFIDPVNSGWVNVIGISLTLAVSTVLLTWLLVLRTTLRPRTPLR